jgi:DNA-binding MarR family transcriptional regulator
MRSSRRRRRASTRLGAPSLPDEAGTIVNGLRRVVRAIELYSQEVYKTYGVTGPQLWAVKTLHRDGPLSAGELARALAVQPSTLSILTARLEQRGLVRRVRARRDRRFVELALTPAGVKVAAAAPEPAQGRLLHGLRTLPRAQLRMISRSVTLLVEMMEATDVEAHFFFADE